MVTGGYWGLWVVMDDHGVETCDYEWLWVVTSCYGWLRVVMG